MDKTSWTYSTQLLQTVFFIQGSFMSAEASPETPSAWKLQEPSDIQLGYTQRRIQRGLYGGGQRGRCPCQRIFWARAFQKWGKSGEKREKMRLIFQILGICIF